MTDSPDVPAAPVALMSYSHDSPEHKRWVGELAAKLVKKGVDVILDQWNTGPGDDLPKFMERAVGGADRVLMICTDAYVQKADDGKGGVGYEAMIVTGELVKDLAMNKFIPIIRQSHGNKKSRSFLRPDITSTLAATQSLKIALRSYSAKFTKRQSFQNQNSGKILLLTKPDPKRRHLHHSDWICRLRRKFRLTRGRPISKRWSLLAAMIRSGGASIS